MLTGTDGLPRKPAATGLAECPCRGEGLTLTGMDGLPGDLLATGLAELPGILPRSDNVSAADGTLREV